MRIYIALACLLLACAPAHAKTPQVGDMAPPFELTLADKSKVTLTDLRGKVIILNYWATWCAPCLEELPLLESYYQVGQQHGLRVYAISTADSGPVSRLSKMLDKLTLPLVRRIKGKYPSPTALPTNYVIDRYGRIRYVNAGAFTLDSLNKIVIPLLNEPPPPVPKVPENVSG